MTDLYYAALFAVIGANVVAILAIALTTTPHAGPARTIRRRLAPQAAKLPRITLEGIASATLVVAVTFAILVMLQTIADVLRHLL